MNIATVPADRAARLLFQLPRTSRVFCKLQPANNWGWSEILANKANYLLEVLTWQNTKDAQKKNPRQQPKMFIPEFMQNVEATRAINQGAEKHTVDDIKDILNRPRKAA